MTMAALKIMVVDDDSNICELLRLYLEKEGYEAVIEENGALALEHFDREQPDLILLDVMMPQLDGYALVRGLRDSGNTIPVLMITARDGFQDMQFGFLAGADDYLVKPINVN